jgi:hypothetical protein
MNPDPLALFKTAMDMHQAQYAATDRLWGYFSVVSLAVVAYSISSEKITRVFPEAITVVVTYVVFCIGNFAALAASQAQLLMLAEILRNRGASAGLNAASFQPFSVEELRGFYLAVVLAICVATILLARHRGKLAVSATRPAVQPPSAA